MVGTTAILVACAAGALVGAALLRLGWRGRCVGDHPFCGRCGFNLFGRPDGASPVCPECGSNVSGARGTRIGTRQRRPRHVVAGAALLLPAIGIGAALGIGRARGVDWQQQKPAWWLVREARWGGTKASGAAVDQLVTRLSAGALDKPHIEELIELALDAQGDVARPWVGGWGNFIESARALGHLSPAQWRTYQEQCATTAQVTLHFRERVSLRHEAPYEAFVEWRVGSASTLYHTTAIVGLVVDGRHEADVPSRPSGHGPVGPGRRRWNRGGFVGREYFDDLPPGRYSGYLRVQTAVAAASDVRPEPPGRPYSSILPGGPEVPGVPVEHRVPFSFELLPREASSARAVADESVRPVVEKRVKVAITRNYGYHGAWVACARPPVNLAFKVIVRTAGEEIDVGSVTFNRGEIPPNPVHAYRRMVDRSKSEAARVDVILRPDRDAAEGAATINEFWDGELTFRDVPVDPDPPLDGIPPAVRALQDALNANAAADADAATR